MWGSHHVHAEVGSILAIFRCVGEEQAFGLIWIRTILIKKRIKKKKVNKFIMPKRQSGNKKNKQSNFAKLSIFQPNKYKFKKSCPLSIKGAPTIDYKNIKLLKKYTSENGKILPSRITNVSQKKQRELSLSIKRARNLALI